MTKIEETARNGFKFKRTLFRSIGKKHLCEKVERCLSRKIQPVLCELFPMPISRFRPKLCSIEAFSGEQHKLNISTSSRRYVVDVFTVQFQLEWGTTHSQTGQLRSRISLSSENLLRKHRPHGRVRLLIDSVKCQSGVMRTTRIQGRGRNEKTCGGVHCPLHKKVYVQRTMLHSTDFSGKW